MCGNFGNDYKDKKIVIWKLNVSAYAEFYYFPIMLTTVYKNAMFGDLSIQTL